MAKFLSDSDFADIRAAINDVVDTFANIEVTYKKLGRRTLSRFNRELTDDQVFTDITLNALQIWEQNEKGFAQVDVKGKWDFSEGYALIAYDAIAAADLVDEDGNVLMEEEVDNIVIKGITYEVRGIIQLGPIKDVDSIVKVQFKKNLKNG